MKKNRSDEAFLKRLKENAPEVLDAEVDFDARVLHIIQKKSKTKKEAASIGRQNKRPKRVSRRK